MDQRRRIDVGDRELVMVRRRVSTPPPPGDCSTPAPACLWAADELQVRVPGCDVRRRCHSGRGLRPELRDAQPLNLRRGWSGSTRRRYCASGDHGVAPAVARRQRSRTRAPWLPHRQRSAAPQLAGARPAEQPGQDVLELCGDARDRHGLVGWGTLRARQPSTWSSTHLPTAVWEVVGDPPYTGSGATSAPRWCSSTARPRRRGWARVPPGPEPGRAHQVGAHVQIVGLEPGHEISWRTIPTGIYQDSTIWTITVEAEGDGADRTRITQRYEGGQALGADGAPDLDAGACPRPARGWRSSPISPDRRRRPLTAPAALPGSFPDSHISGGPPWLGSDRHPSRCSPCSRWQPRRSSGNRGGQAPTILMLVTNDDGVAPRGSTHWSRRCARSRTRGRGRRPRRQPERYGWQHDSGSSPPPAATTASGCASTAVQGFGRHHHRARPARGEAERVMSGINTE